MPEAAKRVLITGAARGIGAGLAERLYGGGARVALLGLEPDLLTGRGPLRRRALGALRRPPP